MGNLESSPLDNIRNLAMFPAPQPSYTSSSIPSPPFYIVDGVPCLWYPSPRPRGIILFAHANGVDLGEIRRILVKLGQDTLYSVIAFEYPGYGSFTGDATPSGCVMAGHKVFNYLRRAHPDAPIVLVGWSIGTGVISQVALKVALPVSDESKIIGIMLVSPFTSIHRMSKQKIGFFLTDMLTNEVFDTKSAVASLTIPLLIVHGNCDNFIPISHSEELIAASASERKQFKVLEGCTHNDLDWTQICSSFNTFFR